MSCVQAAVFVMKASSSSTPLSIHALWILPLKEATEKEKGRC